MDDRQRSRVLAWVTVSNIVVGAGWLVVGTVLGSGWIPSVVGASVLVGGIVGLLLILRRRDR